MKQQCLKEPALVWVFIAEDPEVYHVEYHFLMFIITQIVLALFLLLIFNN